MPGLHEVLKKMFIIDTRQDSEYFSGCEYGSVLNMPGFYKVLNKTLHD